MSGPWAKVSSPQSSKATSLRDVMNEQGQLKIFVVESFCRNCSIRFKLYFQPLNRLKIKMMIQQKRSPKVSKQLKMKNLFKTLSHLILISRQIAHRLHQCLNTNKIIPTNQPSPGSKFSRIIHQNFLVMNVHELFNQPFLIQKY